MAQPPIVERRPRKRIYQGDPLAEQPPAEVVAVIERHVGRRDSLITVLQELQEAFGYLPERPLRHISRGLGIPLSRVYGVATFYNQFRFTPPGKHLIRTCRGTACHVGGSPAILEAMKTHLGVAEEQTTADGLFTLQTVACMGCCSLAPVMTVTEATYGRMTPEAAVATIERVRAGEQHVGG